MQTVSENWKNVHKQTLLNESFVEVSVDIGDPDALADAITEDNGAVYLSHSPELTIRDKSPVPYCTLEQNLWVLDGKRKSIPVEFYVEGVYVSDAMSDDLCVFSSKMPIITLTFSKVFTNLIPGITITWGAAYEEFADTFVVTAYKGNTKVAEKEVVGNHSVKSLVAMDIVNYDRIEVVIKKWCLPNHRARIDEIFLGISRTYSKSELFDYTHTQSVDPLSTSLPKMEIKFSISNVDGEYNPYNQDGWAKYLMDRQEVHAKYGLKQNDGTIEWIKGGTFYLSEWYAKQNGITADFAARDLLEYMSATYVDNHDLSERTLYDLAEQVLYAANLPDNPGGTVKWRIDEHLHTIKTTAPLPQDTLANCLLLIANAGECVIYQDREGLLHIKRSSLAVKDYTISPSVSYTKPEITLSKPINRIDVKVYTYTKGGDGKISSTTNNVSGTVKSTGEIIVIDNPLITDETRARIVASWFVEELRKRMTLDFSWRPDVRLDALDVITSESNYETASVRMTDVEFKFNGAFRGTGKGRVI